MDSYAFVNQRKIIVVHLLSCGKEFRESEPQAWNQLATTVSGSKKGDSESLPLKSDDGKAWQKKQTDFLIKEALQTRCTCPKVKGQRIRLESMGGSRGWRRLKSE